MSRVVVICFHFTIFVVLETTQGRCIHAHQRLWFAFILLSLSYWKQLEKNGLLLGERCDLLSFYYLCRTGNNPSLCCNLCRYVVICFHFTIFVVLETTRGRGSHLHPALWFAFILLSLSYWKQHKTQELKEVKGCDLLSFYYLCRTGNNNCGDDCAALLVVICFHFTIFVVLETTSIQRHLLRIQLWFAFILLSLSYWKQRC